MKRIAAAIALAAAALALAFAFSSTPAQAADSGTVVAADSWCC